MIKESFESVVLSSLARVFPEERPKHSPIEGISILKGEFGAFQFAFSTSMHIHGLKVRLTSELDAKVFWEDLVPGKFPSYDLGDPDLLRRVPALYPDILRPAESIYALPGQWKTLWIEVCSDKAGEYPVTVEISYGDEVVACGSVTVKVADAVLPPQSLIHTNWFHTDCLSTYYNVEVFSEEYWRITEEYMRCARDHGVNMILTPTFTPALDTEVGHERPTVQLVDVEKTAEGYRFNLDKLGRWFDTAQRVGIEYFEIAHFFTQWGAAHTPKVMAHTPDGYRRIFGWETDALDPEYKSFLAAFARAFIPFVEERGLKERCYLHVSDEPSLKIFDDYAAASAIIRELFPGFVIMDAISDYEFYSKGTMDLPIPSSCSIDPFIENGVEGLWTYYCCGVKRGVSNRFLSYPSVRNRALGIQLYKFNIKGFLQWGHNFWYGVKSLYRIDPFADTDGNGSWPSGDPFMVYPGEDGRPLVSLRFKVFREALQDMRALELLESLVGREKTLSILEEGLETPLAFDTTPTDDVWLTDMRARVNKAITENS